jgi:hypothetical protein
MWQASSGAHVVCGGGIVGWGVPQGWDPRAFLGGAMDEVGAYGGGVSGGRTAVKTAG